MSLTRYPHSSEVYIYIGCERYKLNREPPAGCERTGERRTENQEPHDFTPYNPPLLLPLTTGFIIVLQVIYMIFALILLATQAILLAIIAVLARRALVNWVRAVFTPAKEGEQTAFQVFIDKLAQTFATKIMQSARAQISNMASVNSRQNAKLEADGIAAGLPGGFGAIPGIGKAIQKNPLLGMAADWLINKMAQPTNNAVNVPVPASGNSHGNPFEMS